MGWEVARELTSRLVVDLQFVMSESFVHQIFFFFLEHGFSVFTHSR